MGEYNPEFDEASYLAANPDVAAAVRAGSISSGAEHYCRYGKYENRLVKPDVRPNPLGLPFPPDSNPMRRDKILAGMNLSELEGIEIGALASPLVTHGEGPIFYVDHADTSMLRNKYAHEPSIDVSRIVAVDAVWGSSTLQDCIGLDKKVDYVVASHVIEHVPDLISWLSEIRSILRPIGTLRLAVPDRRYTFDYLRFESRVHDVLDAYLRRARTPLPRLILEHNTLIRDVDSTAAWSGQLDAANLRTSSSAQAAIAAAQDALVNGTYYDTHCWVFTPVTFATLFLALADLGLLGFVCTNYIETARNDMEFFVHLAPCDDKTVIIDSWNSMKRSLLRSATYQRSERDEIEAKVWQFDK